MKIAKITTVAAVVALTVAIGISAFAAPQMRMFNSDTTSDAPPSMPQRPQLTEDELAEIRGKADAQKEEMEQMFAKWDSLTDAQKEEIYAIHDKQLNSQIELIDKYLELGLIDQETANQMKERIAENKENIRNGNFSMGVAGINGGFSVHFSKIEDGVEIERGSRTAPNGSGWGAPNSGRPSDTIIKTE